MKYIKLFEDYHNTYHEITLDEYNLLLWGEETGDEDEDTEIAKETIEKKWEDFTDREIENINKVGFHFIKNTTEYIKPKLDYKFFPNLRLKNPTTYVSNLIIFKLKDEWYIVFRLDYDSKENHWKKSMYKCDQFDGLIDCLEMIKQQDEFYKVRKIDEAFNQEGYYQEIQEEEYKSKVYNKVQADEDEYWNYDSEDIESFRKSEIEYLTNAFEDEEWKIYKDIPGNLRRPGYEQLPDESLVIIDRYTSFEVPIISITKLKDEWIYIYDINNQWYFKCDQLDGAFACLKKLKEYY
jgi:hypothetical protein